MCVVIYKCAVCALLLGTNLTKLCVVINTQETVRNKHSFSVIRATIAFYIAIQLDVYFKLTLGFLAHQHFLTNPTIRVRWIDSTNLSIRVRWTDPTNLTIGRIFTAYLSLTNALRLIHQSNHSCPMDRFDESFHSCMDPTNQTICVRWTEPDLF